METIKNQLHLSSHAARPLPLNERKLAPDLARGVMLLLIALAYAPLYVTSVEPGVLALPSGGSVLDRVVNFVSMVLVNHRSYPMFAALFGYGMVILVSRQLSKGMSEGEVRRLLKRRALYLLLFGFVHYLFIFPAEILGPYGLATLIIGWLMFRSDRTLAKGAAITGFMYIVIASFIWIGLAIIFQGVGADQGTIVATHFGKALLTRLWEYPFFLLFNLLGFPILAAMLIGAWAARKGLMDNPEQHLTFLRRTAVVGILISVIGGIPLALIGVELWQPAPLIAGAVEALHIFTGIAGGLGYAAIFGLLSARNHNRVGPVTRALAATGKRSLTCYLLQSVLLMLLLSPMTIGLGEALHSTGAMLMAIMVWLIGVGLASWLEHIGQRGPLDALLRRLVYRR